MCRATTGWLELPPWREGRFPVEQDPFDSTPLEEGA